MALLQNITLNNQYPYRRSGATATNTETGKMLSQFGPVSGREFTRFIGGLPAIAALPVGYNPGILMPLRHVQISSWREAEITISPVANGLMGLPATAQTTITVYPGNSERLPLDDTPQAVTATSSFSVFPDDLVGGLITSGIGVSYISLTTNTPLLVATLEGAGSSSYQLYTNTPLLGALAFNFADISITITSFADILPLDDSPILRDAAASFSFSGSMEPYATGILDGEAFLAGGTIDEFAVLGRMEYDNAIHIDAVNGSPGTRSPIGTLASPVSNIIDALVIANSLNLTRLHIISDMTILSTDDISGYTLFSDDWKVIIIEPGAGTTNTVFEKLSLYGELCGTWNVLIDCWAYDITNFLGWVRGGSIERVELAEYIDPDPFSLGSSYFDDIVPMYAAINSVLVMNTGVRVSFTNSTDTVEIWNMEDGNILNASLSGGGIVVDASCLGGEIIVSGAGTLENSSALTVVDAGLNNEDTVWGAVAADNNISGTMGNKLNTASSGGVDLNALAAAVWDKTVESGNSAEEILKVLASVLAGKVSGAGTGTETFKGIDGTTNRVVSTVDDDGNRTSVILNVT